LAYSLTDLIRQNFQSDLAYRHVVGISQYHRIQGSPGFRAAAGYVADHTAAAGLEVSVRHYPADGKHSFWTAPGFLEWSCESATLATLDQDGNPCETLCDFAAIATSLIQRSIPVEGDFEVVALAGKGGTDAADYVGVDVVGRLVLTNRPVDQVHHIAVRRHGAAGILFDGMSLGGRSDLDLPDARQYTSFWWPGATAPDGWGFVLSPRQGRRLREQLAEGQTPRLRATIHSHFDDGSFEVVEALIPGKEEAGKEVLLVSHLCHPQPGAHDNGSGAAALIETAGTLARLIARGFLPPPTRGIRFLWVPEMTGTYAWCAEHEAEISRGRWIAGLNLDMVGADQCQTGSVWELVNLPEASASFADHLLAWLREPLLDDQRHRESRFGAGSDHYILSDPTVGIPTPMLTQWPDRFYHTSADAPDKVSPESLARSGRLAAAYAWWLASAGLSEARWLGHWMVTRFTARAGRASAEAAERLRTTTRSDATSYLAEYRRRSKFNSERMLAGLDTLVRLDPHIEAHLGELHAAVHEAAVRELRWVDTQVTTEPPDELVPDLDPTVGAKPAAACGTSERPTWVDAKAEWRAEARRLVPRRLAPGPIDPAMALQARGGQLMPTFWALIPSGQAASEFHDQTALGQYWADGQRNIAEITDLVALETGRPVGDILLRYFTLLAQAGLVELHEPS
jgi:Peptidase family M28